jgi:hypothetical protein
MKINRFIATKAGFFKLIAQSLQDKKFTLFIPSLLHIFEVQKKVCRFIAS